MRMTLRDLFLQTSKALYRHLKKINICVSQSTAIHLVRVYKSYLDSSIFSYLFDIFIKLFNKIKFLIRKCMHGSGGMIICIKLTVLINKY